jgi:hypothetical protein
MRRSVKDFSNSGMESEMDSKRRPTALELEELRSKHVGAIGAVTTDGEWMRADQPEQVQPVAVMDVAETPKMPKEKTWNTWDHWEEMRAH